MTSKLPGFLWLCATVSALATNMACAAPPLVTEDAGTLETGRCQLEFEQRHFRHAREQDLLPACNFFLDTELQAGFLRTLPQGSASERRWLVQAKRTLAEWEREGLALGIALGTIRQQGQPGHQHYVTLPLTGTFDRTVLSLNLGGVRNSDDSRWKHFTAAAAEHDVNGRFSLVGEIFRTQGGATTVQGGFRYWLVSKKIQLTGSVGSMRGQRDEGRWTSLGIRFETD